MRRTEFGREISIPAAEHSRHTASNIVTMHEEMFFEKRGQAKKETFSKVSPAEHSYFRFSFPIGATRRPTSAQAMVRPPHREREKEREEKRDTSVLGVRTDAHSETYVHRGPAHVRFNRTLN